MNNVAYYATHWVEQCYFHWRNFVKLITKLWRDDCAFLLTRRDENKQSCYRHWYLNASSECRILIGYTGWEGGHIQPCCLSDTELQRRAANRMFLIGLLTADRKLTIKTWLQSSKLFFHRLAGRDFKSWLGAEQHGVFELESVSG